MDQKLQSHGWRRDSIKDRLQEKIVVVSSELSGMGLCFNVQLQESIHGVVKTNMSDDSRRAMGQQGNQQGNQFLHPHAKVDFPKFDGSNSTSWFLRCNNYFKWVPNIPDAQKIKMACLNLEGRAALWYKCSRIGKTELSWSQLVAIILARFENIKGAKILVEFSKLKHTGSYNDYVDMFEELKDRLMMLNQGRYTGDHFIASFITGVHEDMQVAINFAEPTTLRQTIEFGRKHLLSTEEITRKLNSSVSVTEMDDLSLEFSDVSEEPTEFSPSKGAEHQVTFKPNSMPQHQLLYRASHNHKDENKRILKELLECGLIQRSKSPFVSPLILFKQKDKSWRMCVDYRQVLSILRENKLYAKMSKCQFGKKNMEYLVHILSGKGAAFDPSKISCRVNGSLPKILNQLRGFLGLPDCNREFIKRYGLISRPLTNLLRDCFNWTSSEDLVFNQLKETMTTIPIIALLDFSLLFLVKTDACGLEIGTELMQIGRPISYMSKALSPQNHALPIYERQFLVIVMVVQKWKSYLQGHKFVIHIDQALKYLFDQVVVSPIQQKWFTKLVGLDYEICYKKMARGFGRATHLLKSNFSIFDFEVYKPTLPQFESKLGIGVSSLVEISKDVDVLVYWVSNGNQVEGGLFWEHGAVAVFASGATIGDIHYIAGVGRFIPAGETKFAIDALSCYRSSNLHRGVEEKTGGHITTNSVESIFIQFIRKGGLRAVCEHFSNLKKESACIVDVVVFVAGLIHVELAGESFLCRSATSIASHRVGIIPKAPVLPRAMILFKEKVGEALGGWEFDRFLTTSLRWITLVTPTLLADKELLLVPTCIRPSRKPPFEGQRLSLGDKTLSTEGYCHGNRRYGRRIVYGGWKCEEMKSLRLEPDCNFGKKRNFRS